MWALRYDRCVSCGTTEKRHHGRGLCTTCYARVHRIEIRDERNAYQRERNKRPDVIAKIKAYNQRPDVKARSAARMRKRRRDDRTGEREYQRRWYLKNKYDKNGILALERDDFKCQNPGCTSEKPVVIHHIDWNEENNEIENLVTLCRSCHTRIHQWQPPELRRAIFDEWILEC